ncbi:MAG: 3-phosphoserine/phosphohydroxythreonine transaminase, partial [Polyangiaceae bacterium]|nr:3-phosphoserine/phosphohydroxythreonine transaminase [Polyangiaceae bacterium]
MSILEHSHRAASYEKVHNETKSLFVELLGVPETHDVLFMQGGASAQFALVPMNLLAGKSADYVITGAWSEKAFKEAKVVGKAREAGTGKVGESYTRVPTQSELSLDPEAAYVHITTNNTIMGTQFHYVPETGNVPLIADASSDILWKPTDISKYGVLYAGAQKNIGPAGITIVVIRKDLLERVPTTIPSIFRYTTVAKDNSLHNTIPTFSMYMIRNVLRWVKEQGGAKAMEERNLKKAATLYGAIDANPDFFRCPVEKASRSVMNPVFRLPSEELEKKLIDEAKKAGFVGIKGHRSVGGIRVSMYNPTEPASVESFVSYIEDFAKKNS